MEYRILDMKNHAQRLMGCSICKMEIGINLLTGFLFYCSVKLCVLQNNKWE